MTVGMLALIIIAILLLQLAILAFTGFYRRRCQYRDIDRRVNEPQTLKAQGSAPFSTVVTKASSASWEGFREFRVQRREVENKDTSVCSFYLVPIDGQPLPGFRPGQFLTFRLATKDPVTHQPKTVVRCYSLSDRPQPNYYRVSIKRMAAPTDQPEVPPGLSSNFFHDHVRERNTLEVKAPSGHFHLTEDEPLPMVLIGGGIGITPMLSIINTLLESGSQREIWLYYGVHNGTEMIMKRHLQQLDDEYENFHLHLCYSAPDGKETEGVDYQHRGRVDIPLLKKTLKPMRYQFYVCGPKTMMESLVPGLEAWGVDARDIYYESFGPATLVRREKPESMTAAQTVTVTFRKSGKCVSWDPSTNSLLDFAEENNIAVESGCRAGSCGCCQTTLESGEIEYNQQPDAEIEPGHCLLCISTPKGDLTLAA